MSVVLDYHRLKNHLSSFLQFIPSVDTLVPKLQTWYDMGEKLPEMRLWCTDTLFFFLQTSLGNKAALLSALKLYQTKHKQNKKCLCYTSYSVSARYQSLGPCMITDIHVKNVLYDYGLSPVI